MHTKSLRKLRLELTAAKQEIPVDSMWCHMGTQNLYVVLGHLIIESSEEAGVIYAEPSLKDVPFTRPAREWNEEIALAGVLVPRFRIVDWSVIRPDGPQVPELA